MLYMQYNPPTMAIDPINAAESQLHTQRGRSWRDQFDAEDQDLASYLVNNLVLVASATFSRATEQLIHQQAASIDGAVALYGVREIKYSECYLPNECDAEVNAVGPGPVVGSEGIVTSMIGSIAKSDKNKYLSHPNIEQMRSARCRAIFVVDDLIGSGKRTREFIDNIWKCKTIRSWHSLGLVRFVAIAFAATSRGEDSVSHASAKDVAVCHVMRCPTAYNLLWGTSVRESIADLCIKYGKRTEEPNFSLGFDDTMAMLVFEHSCPNNVPAILWARGAVGNTWEPLFDNRYVGMDEKSVFPLEIEECKGLSVLRELNQNKITEEGLERLRKPDGRKIIVLLSLAKKRIRDLSKFAVATSLSDAECRTLLLRCVEWGFLTATYELTSDGHAELYRMRRIWRKEIEIPDRGNDCYYPKMLRATSG